METLIWMFIAGVLVFIGLLVSRRSFLFGIGLIVVAIAYVAFILLAPRIMGP